MGIDRMDFGEVQQSSIGYHQLFEIHVPLYSPIDLKSIQTNQLFEIDVPLYSPFLS